MKVATTISGGQAHGGERLAQWQESLNWTRERMKKKALFSNAAKDIVGVRVCAG